MTALRDAALKLRSLRRPPLGDRLRRRQRAVRGRRGALRADGQIVLLPLRGWADPKAVASYPHHWIRSAQIGRLCRLCARKKAAASWCSSAPCSGPSSGRCAPTCSPAAAAAAHQAVSRRRRSPAVGRRSDIRGAGLRGDGRARNGAENPDARPGPAGGTRRTSATWPTSPADLRCCARTGPFDVGQAVGRRRAATSRGGGRRGNRCHAGAGGRAAPDRPHPGAGWRPHQGAESQTRIVASTCRRLGRRPSRARCARSLTESQP